MSPDDLVLKPGAIEALNELHALGYALILVSNQAAFAKGKTSLQSLWAVHERFVSLVEKHGVRFLDYLYSFSHPDGLVPGFSGVSAERKPSPYFLLVAQARHDLDLSRSWMIGDRDTDIECGRAAGVATIRVTVSRADEKAGVSKPTCLAADLREAAALIAQVSRQGMASERRLC
jgi:D-glycero-D-manno-heptose 1,7-bisphosphate phosphatase